MFEQYLAAGLIDEMQVHVVPVLLGDGVRLFDARCPARRARSMSGLPIGR